MEIKVFSSLGILRGIIKTGSRKRPFIETKCPVPGTLPVNTFG
jgi:hypothetical protein